MNLSEGDTLLQKYHRNGNEYEQRYTVKLVEFSHVELTNGDYVPISEIEKDVQQGRTRVIHQ